MYPPNSQSTEANSSDGMKSDHGESNSFQPSQQSVQIFACPRCLTSNQPDATLCISCGFTFATVGATVKLRTSGIFQGVRKLPAGKLVAQRQILLAFHFDGHEIVLPNSDSVLIGRANPGDPTPDIDLSRAANYGISRQHVRITRRRSLFHLCDLQSANGTFLNGKKLAPFQENLLHDGDELRLSRLTIRVRFTK